MQVNDALIDKLCLLSRLEFNANEKESVKNDLNSMLTFVEKINELNLDGVEPLIDIFDNKNIFREDKVIETITREEALKNVPHHTDQFIQVPKVMKK
jgi:aspartyl-tRNA(Asn)/glutamyl-tRNA(Gln) amidotransferase subunit C